MTTDQKTKGQASTVFLLVAFGLVLIFGPILYYRNQKQTNTDNLKPQTEKIVKLPEKIDGYSGKVLAGNKSFLLDFNKADYEKALVSGKLIVIYFYANWCPICKNEVPKLYSAFNELDSDKVMGFI